MAIHSLGKYYPVIGISRLVHHCGNMLSIHYGFGKLLGSLCVLRLTAWAVSLDLPGSFYQHAVPPLVTCYQLSC